MSPLASPSFLVHACGRAIEPPRAERAAPPFPHGRPPRRATPARSRHSGYPRSQRPGAPVSGWLHCCFAGWTKDSPATRRRTLRCARVVPCVQGLAFVPSWFVQGGGRGGGDRAPQRHGQARAYHPSPVLVGGPCFFLCSVTRWCAPQRTEDLSTSRRILGCRHGDAFRIAVNRPSRREPFSAGCMRARVLAGRTPARLGHDVAVGKAQRAGT
jgi:hypothetical protein